MPSKALKRCWSHIRLLILLCISLTQLTNHSLADTGLSQEQQAVLKQIATSDSQSQESQEKRQQLEAKFLHSLNPLLDENVLIGEQPSSTTWQTSFNTLMRPMLDTIEGLSEKPRLISELEARLYFLYKRKEQTQNALEQLNAIESNEEQSSIVSGFIVRWQTHLKATNNAIDAIEAAKEDIEKSHNLNNANERIRQAIQYKLISFGLSIACALAILFISHQLSDLTLKLRYKGNHHVLESSQRIGRYAIRFSGYVTALLSFLVIFYLRSEWFLLGLALLAIVVVLLSVKNLLPQYMVEIRTLLNLGSAREGEKVVYNGLPFYISKLDVYSELLNPTLKARYRLPLTELANLRSRAFHSDEAWFPTKNGDWVFVDGQLGKVLNQTAEAVVLDSFGSQLVYSPQAFAGAIPRNISVGNFIISINFGIDYCYQQQITKTAQTKLLKHLQQQLEQQDFSEHIDAINVDFCSASASSLDYKVILVVQSELASQYYVLERWLQRACVNACNEYDWTIPFAQLTVHQEAD